MANVLKGLTLESDPNLLVGFNKADDAGVYKISDTQALVQTVDFFPPIVDDPYGFGQIAAANALSDIYAMGGRPLTALNIVGFPPKMPPDILVKILQGGGDKVKEAGAVIAGGHSIRDSELKYGVACTGIIDIDKIVSNDKARPGDILFLTKPLGTGIIATAIKQDKATDDDIKSVIAQMSELNKTASELMVKHNVHAATDITGYGIIGHGLEMANGSQVTLRLQFDSLPFMAKAIEFAKLRCVPGGANANHEFAEGQVQFSDKLEKHQTDILFDPQTSGGLLMSFAPDDANTFKKEADAFGINAYEIGHVSRFDGKAIIVD